MRTTTHKMARRLRCTIYFAFESDHHGTFWRDGRFCRHSPTGDDDEKTSPHARDLHRADGSCDNAFPRAKHQPTRFHSRTACRQSADEWLRTAPEGRRFDRLDRWRPRTAAPICPLTRVRGGEGPARDGNWRRFEGASDQVSGRSNTGIAIQCQPSGGDRSEPTGLGAFEVMACSPGCREHGRRTAPIRCGRAGAEPCRSADKYVQGDYPRPARLALPAPGFARQESAPRRFGWRNAGARCTDPLTVIDVPHFVNQTRHTLSAQVRDSELYIFKIVKRH